MHSKLLNLPGEMGRIQRKFSKLLGSSSYKTFPQDTLFVHTQTARFTPAEQPAVTAVSSEAISPFSPRLPASSDSDWEGLEKSQSVDRTVSSTLRTHSSDLCSTGEWVESPSQETTAGKENKDRDPGATWRHNLQEMSAAQPVPPSVCHQPQVSLKTGRQRSGFVLSAVACPVVLFTLTTNHLTT